jgi:hypothetical protein
MYPAGYSSEWSSALTMLTGVRGATSLQPTHSRLASYGSASEFCALAAATLSSTATSTQLPSLRQLPQKDVLIACS